jgi:hypothetical protein
MGMGNTDRNECSSALYDTSTFVLLMRREGEGKVGSASAKWVKGGFN